MADTVQDRFRTPRRTPWKATVTHRLLQVETDVEVAIHARGWRLAASGPKGTLEVDPTASGPLPPAAAAQAVAIKLYAVTAKARQCLWDDANTSRWSRWWWRAWWWITGDRLMSAYIYLHAAERTRVLLVTEEQLTALLPAIRFRVEAYLPATDPRRAAFKDAFDAPQCPEPQPWRILTALRSACRHEQMPEGVPGPRQQIAAAAIGAAYTSEDQEQAQVRRFRGVLFGTAAGLAAVAACLWIVGVVHPELIPMCFPTKSGSTICAGGTATTSGVDLPLIEGLGALGAMLAVAKTLTDLRPKGVRYSLSVAQGLVKITLGAITAVLGIVLLRNETTLAATLGTQAGLLSAAVVFGYAQQLFTGLIDKRANSLLNAAAPAET